MVNWALGVRKATGTILLRENHAACNGHFSQPQGLKYRDSGKMVQMVL